MASNWSVSAKTWTPSGVQHQEVVADPLQIGDEMRPQDDGREGLGDGVDHGGEEFPAGEWVEAGEGFVEQQQAWPLGEPEAQRHLARWPPESRSTRRSSGTPNFGRRSRPNATSKSRLSLSPIVSSSPAVKSRYTDVVEGSASAATTECAKPTCGVGGRRFAGAGRPSRV